MKKNNEPLFKILDTYFYDQLQGFKQTPLYNKYLDFIATINSENPVFVHKCIFSAVIFFPLILTGVLILSNASVKKRIELKKSIFESAHEIVQNGQEVQNLTRNLATNLNTNSEYDLKSEISAIASNSSIDIKKISIANFNNSTISDTIQEVSFTLNFTGFSLKNFTDLTKQLILYKRIKLRDVLVSKSNNQLNGSLSITTIRSY